MAPDEIKALRQDMGLSQQRFADALRQVDPLLGVDRQTVYRWENGSQAPNRHSTRALERMRQRNTTPGPQGRRKGEA